MVGDMVTGYGIDGDMVTGYGIDGDMVTGYGVVEDMVTGYGVVEDMVTGYSVVEEMVTGYGSLRIIAVTATKHLPNRCLRFTRYNLFISQGRVIITLFFCLIFYNVIIYVTVWYTPTRVS